MRAILPKLQTYVSFIFSPAFINGSVGREKHLFEEETRTSLPPGTLTRILEQYKEVEVPNRELSTLPVPKGALHFRFYDRLKAIARCQKKSMTLRSDDTLNETGKFYLDNEGDFFHRSGLESDSYSDLPPPWRKHLLELMDQHDSSRIIRVTISGSWDTEEHFILGPNDSLINPNQVQMVDTDIPWCRP